MNDDLVEIYRALYSQHAQMLKNTLEENGIQSFVSGEATAGALGLQGLAWEGSPRVYVAQQDAAQAVHIVADFEQSLKANPDDPDDDENEFFNRPSKEWADWPKCPTCSARRVAACPLCDTTGTDFSLAEFVVDAEGPLLTCPNCDEYFPPNFCRTCDDCGHDYGSGTDVVVYDTDVINYRAVVLTIAILALGCAAVCYFVAISQ